MKPAKTEADPGKYDLMCPKHKSTGSKGWLIHVIDGFVIEESSVPFQVNCKLCIPRLTAYFSQNSGQQIRHLWKLLLAEK